MPTLSFPFITIRFGEISRPYIPVQISNPNTSYFLDVYALIDTGADECALPSSFAKALGHNLESGKAKTISTINGDTIVYSHTSVIEFENYSTGPIIIDYMPNLSTPL